MRDPARRRKRSGHLLGEHGYTGKLAYALYPEMTDTVLMVRHPGGEGAGTSSDFYASTHDVAPTILDFLGIEQPAPMDGQNLIPLLEGKEPLEPRYHITQGYKDYVCCRDDHRVMFCRTDGTNAHLFDAVTDADQRRVLAETEPETVRRITKITRRETRGTPSEVARRLTAPCQHARASPSLVSNASAFQASLSAFLVQASLCGVQRTAAVAVGFKLVATPREDFLTRRRPEGGCRANTLDPEKMLVYSLSMRISPVDKVVNSPRGMLSRRYGVSWRSPGRLHC